MPTLKGKIINDPVYGFIRIPEPELMRIIEHPWFQRLRFIRQMGMAHLVYPGAEHTRFHHSLGASHLMGKALDELKIKNIEFSQDECTAARLAILLHDVGHGPFSHALEHSLVTGITHEHISRLIMARLNTQMGGILDKAIEIFEHRYPRKYLHQLVSSQLDVDRMDYLNRDSFYTGVSEGVIGYDRILQMLTVYNDELAVEEKGIHSVEKFIIARRLMYWQVYLHKTVLGSEYLLINILKRAKELARTDANIFATPALKHFLYQQISAEAFVEEPEHLEQFCKMDDTDVLISIKIWQEHPDPVLSRLCRMLIRRKLYKVIFSNAISPEIFEAKKNEVMKKLNISEEFLPYFVFSGVTSNNTYDPNDDRIMIAMKDGSVADISTIENTLVNQTTARIVQKQFMIFTEE